MQLSPWQGLLDAQREMDRLFRRFFDRSDVVPSLAEGEDTTAWVPAVDVFTRDGDLIVRAELPGIDPEKDLDISVEGNGAYRMETHYGAFERRILLPDGVNDDDISATYENGILEVVVPKAAGLTGAKRIPVQAGARKALTARGRKKD